MKSLSAKKKSLKPVKFMKEAIMKNNAYFIAQETLMHNILYQKIS